MDLHSLCEKISMPKEIMSQIEKFLADYDMAAVEPMIEELRNPKTCASGKSKVQELFADAAPANIHS